MGDAGKLGTSLDTASDALLADRAADGDLTAFTVLLRRTSPGLRAYITRITRRPADTDDILQEVAVLVWQELPRLRDTTAVTGWMMRIASRAALAHLRRSPQHDPIQEDERQDPAPPPEEVAEQRERVARLGMILSALPQQQAQCWLLREVGGYSYDEIAEQLDVPVSTVRGALAQARKRILQELGGWR